jgi:hypothetical protein
MLVIPDAQFDLDLELVILDTDGCGCANDRGR